MGNLVHNERTKLLAGALSTLGTTTAASALILAPIALLALGSGAAHWWTHTTRS